MPKPLWVNSTADALTFIALFLAGFGTAMGAFPFFFLGLLSVGSPHPVLGLFIAEFVFWLLAFSGNVWVSLWFSKNGRAVLGFISALPSLGAVIYWYNSIWNAFYHY